MNGEYGNISVTEFVFFLLLLLKWFPDEVGKLEFPRQVLYYLMLDEECQIKQFLCLSMPKLVLVKV